MSCALREARLGAQVQQRKPIMSRKYVLPHLGFAQRYEDWTFDDWKHVIFSDETKINWLYSNDRSRCWIGDGEPIGPQPWGVHCTKHVRVYVSAEKGY